MIIFLPFFRSFWYWQILIGVLESLCSFVPEAFQLSFIPSYVHTIVSIAFLLLLFSFVFF